MDSLSPSVLPLRAPFLQFLLLCFAELHILLALVVAQLDSGHPDFGRMIALSLGDARDVVSLIIVGLGIRRGDLKVVLCNELKT